MDWDSEIKNDGSDFELIPDNTVCNFQVTEFEKARTSKGDPMAKLKLSLLHGDTFGRTTENLVLNEACEWKLCQFFIAIGQRKTGETLKPDWSKVKGAEGHCVVKVRGYQKDGRGEEKFTNDVATFLEPEEGLKRYEADMKSDAAKEDAAPAEDDNLNLG